MYSYSLITQSTVHTKFRFKAGKVIKAALIDYRNIELIKVSLSKTHRRLIRAQFKLRNQHLALEARIQVLSEYWSRLLLDLKFWANKQGDSSALKIVERLMAINPKIKRTCLVEFVKRCRLLHIIAFMQWRQLSGKATRDANRIITERSNHLRYMRMEAFEKTKEIQKAIAYGQQENDIPKKLLVKYRLNNYQYGLKSFHINTFAMIALPDPFPDDHL